MPNHSINGKVALIAGGAKNLGGLIARDLAKHGAKAVVVHYNSASSPFLSSISINLQEGPPGFFVPASQARTVAALVLIMMAKAAWLTFRRERRALTLSALNLGTWLAR